MNPILPSMTSRQDAPLLSARSIAAMIASLIAASGCSTMPTSGPLVSDIYHEYKSGEATPPFALVDVSEKSVGILNGRAGPSFVSAFGREEEPPPIRIGAGDSISVTLWEAGVQPLFSAGPTLDGLPTAGAHSTTFPEQVVQVDGSISIPFAGKLIVAGKEPWEAQGIIETALRSKTAASQVQFSIVHSLAGSATLVGDGVGGGRIQLSPAGTRVLDLLAAAGGWKNPTFQTWVSISRDGHVITMPLSTLLSDSAENIYVHPGDIVSLNFMPATFTVFGATFRNAQVPFDAPHLTLADALAKSGGLIDTRSDPAGIFLLRMEAKETVSALTHDLAPAEATTGSGEPVIYRLNLAKASDYFLARQFELRDGDILYVANAPANELEKVLQLIGLLSQPVVSGAVLGTAVKN